MMFDLIIRNGTLIDGANTPRRRADVAVTQGRIAEIGVIHGSARDEINAQGRIVAPGFIEPTPTTIWRCWPSRI